MVELPSLAKANSYRYTDALYMQGCHSIGLPKKAQAFR